MEGHRSEALWERSLKQGKDIVTKEKIKEGPRKRYRKQMQREGGDAMERGHELCLCDMGYNKESGEKGGHRC